VSDIELFDHEEPRKVPKPIDVTGVPKSRLDLEFDADILKNLDPSLTVQQLRAIYFSNHMISNLREKYTRKDIDPDSYEARQKKLVA